MNDEVRKTLKIHGRVQGVGFRWWARHHASRLGLRGAVRNCSDGTVEITLAGTREAVDEMCLRLATGPVSAEVRRLEELPPPDVVPHDFQIGL